MTNEEMIEKFRLMLVDEAFNRRGEHARLYADDPLLLVSPNQVTEWFRTFVEYEGIEAPEEE